MRHLPHSALPGRPPLAALCGSGDGTWGPCQPEGKRGPSVFCSHFSPPVLRPVLGDREQVELAGEIDLDRNICQRRKAVSGSVHVLWELSRRAVSAEVGKLPGGEKLGRKSKGAQGVFAE